MIPAELSTLRAACESALSRAEGKTSQPVVMLPAGMVLRLVEAAEERVASRPALVMDGYIVTNPGGGTAWDTLQPYAQGCRNMAAGWFNGGWREAYRRGYRVVAVNVVRKRSTEGTPNA